MATISLQLAITWGMLAIPDSAAKPTSDWQPRVQALIRQLGDPSFAKREAAAKALLAEGDKIVPLLDKARASADLEMARRIDRIRYQLVGFVDDLTAFLGGPAFSDPEAGPKGRVILPFLVEPPNPLHDIVALVAAHQPRSGDFLLKIIADPKHQLHRPATQLFCETWSSGSPRQLHAYLETSFDLLAMHRTRYPQGIDAYIETRYWHRYGSDGWPKKLPWQTHVTHFLDGKKYGKPFVFNHPGAGATTAWINAGKLDQGQHVVRVEVGYVFTQQGSQHQGKIRSREFAFAVGPAVLANDLIAPTDAALAKQVREALRFLDYDGQDGRDKVRRPWHPQITWVEPNGKSRGLHMPVWSVKESLPVDLCFEATIRDVHSGQRFPGDELVLHKGKTSRGHFAPRDARAFCADRDGFVEVEIELQPSRSQALTDPAITSYFGWPVRSPTLRAKIIGEGKNGEIR